mmetsp:Transcript_18966/g.51394  ORF Transcript_18966/g.51394 Transcript_18966/m.51394 type:complete len:92 (-) Transcript_18966:33-308(-)|eukprot:4732454-Prymnesium_polylepis.1
MGRLMTQPVHGGTASEEHKELAATPAPRRWFLGGAKHLLMAASAACRQCLAVTTAGRWWDRRRRSPEDVQNRWRRTPAEHPEAKRSRGTPI